MASSVTTKTTKSSPQEVELLCISYCTVTIDVIGLTEDAPYDETPSQTLANKTEIAVFSSTLTFWFLSDLVNILKYIYLISIGKQVFVFTYTFFNVFEGIFLGSWLVRVASWPAGPGAAGRLPGEDNKSPRHTAHLFLKIEPVSSSRCTLSSTLGLVRLVAVSLEGEGGRRRLAYRCQ